MPPKAKNPATDKTHYLGKTFFALYQSEKMLHDRMLYVGEPQELDAFFKWIQSERKKIEDEHKTVCVVISCYII